MIHSASGAGLRPQAAYLRGPGPEQRGDGAMPRRILIIEDHQEIADLLVLHLRDLPSEVVSFQDGLAGLAAIESSAFDLVILDLMLPGIGGLEILKRLRSRSNYTPVLVLTSKTAEIDRVIGLELGADDYVTKPFSITELTARVKAIFRRVDALTQQAAEPGGTLRAGALEIDADRRSVMLDGRQVDLTAKEFDLLVFFARNPGRVFTRAQLLDKVWGYSHSGYEHTVNSHINRLRAKIERDPARPEYLLTVWSVGYKFSDTLNPAGRPPSS